MKDIVDAIDAVLLGALPNDGIRFWGFCQPVLKGTQIHPVTIEDNKQVSIDGNYDAVCFHRLNGSGNFTVSDEQAFGRSTGKKIIQSMRLFIAHKTKKGEEWIWDFVNEIPEIVDVTDAEGISLYEFVDIGDITIITDQKAIYEQEFGENSYEKHTIPWNIYAIDYNVEFIKC